MEAGKGIPRLPIAMPPSIQMTLEISPIRCQPFSRFMTFAPVGSFLHSSALASKGRGRSKTTRRTRLVSLALFLRRGGKAHPGPPQGLRRSRISDRSHRSATSPSTRRVFARQTAGASPRTCRRGGADMRPTFQSFSPSQRKGVAF